jgi:hypothetical protein
VRIFSGFTTRSQKDHCVGHDSKHISTLILPSDIVSHHGFSWKRKGGTQRLCRRSRSGGLWVHDSIRCWQYDGNGPGRSNRIHWRKSRGGILGRPNFRHNANNSNHNCNNHEVILLVTLRKVMSLVLVEVLERFLVEEGMTVVRRDRMMPLGDTKTAGHKMKANTMTMITKLIRFGRRLMSE